MQVHQQNQVEILTNISATILTMLSTNQGGLYQSLILILLLVHFNDRFVLHIPDMHEVAAQPYISCMTILNIIHMRIINIKLL